MSDSNNLNQLRDLVWHISGDISNTILTSLDVVWRDLETKTSGDLADSIVANAVADVMSHVLAKMATHLEGKPYNRDTSKPLRDRIKKMCGDVITKIMLEHKPPEGTSFGVARFEKGPEH